MQPRKILVSAGEASGDLYASLVVEELRRALPGRRVLRLHRPAAAGGRRADRGGCRQPGGGGAARGGGAHPADLRRIPQAAGGGARPSGRTWPSSPIRRISTCAWRAGCTAQGIPVVYLVAPQAWAWRKGRVREMRRTLRRLLCIFPFEEEFFPRRRGCRPPTSATPWPGWCGRPSPGRVFSETQAGRGPSINSGAARKPPRGGGAPSACAAGRRGAALPGAGRECGAAGLGDHRGRVFSGAPGRARRSG